MTPRRALLVVGPRAVCWHCQHQASYRVPTGTYLLHTSSTVKSNKLTQKRTFSASSRSLEQESVTTIAKDQSPQLPSLFTRPARSRPGVRTKLRSWHAQNINIDETYILNEFQPSSINVEDRAARTEEWPTQTPEDEDTSPDQMMALDAFDRMSAPYEGMESLVIEFGRGDLVELTAKTGSSLAVFLTSSGEYNIFYAQDGSLRFTSHTGGLFRARRYFAQQEVQPIVDAIPERAFDTKDYDELRDLRTCIPLEHGAHILRGMARFQTASENYYRNHSKIMDDLHTHVADASEYKVMRISQLANAVLNSAKVDRSSLENAIAFEHAVVRAIVRHPFGFTASMQDLVQHEEIGIEPVKSVKSINAARAWIRAYQSRQAATSQSQQACGPKKRASSDYVNRVEDFLEKCRILISESRLIRPMDRHRQVLSGDTSRSEIVADTDGIVRSLEFNDDDRCLIMFVMHACHQNFTHNPALLGLTAVLLRATGAYDDISESLGVDSETRRNFLVEIGVLQPFTMVRAFDRDVLSSGNILPNFQSESHHAKDHESSCNKEFGLYDTMSDLRKDWGNMLVLAIDKAGTQVVDDGISIEPVLNEPGMHWLHVHVSHISAWMPHDSSLARMASNATQTQYFCEGAMHMLPSHVTKQHSIRKEGTVLTFSMKVDMPSGEVSDFHMQPGIVHNVQYADKDQVDTHLGLCDRKFLRQKNSTVVGAEQRPKEQETGQQLSNEAGETCALLHSVARSVSKSLLVNTEETAANIEIARPRHNINVLGLQQIDEAFSKLDEQPTHAKFSTKSPTIRWSHYEEAVRVGWNKGDAKASFDQVIQTFMMLAGLEAAKWASARKIPLPYFGSGISGEDVLEQRDRFRDELLRAAKAPQLVDHNVTSKLWRYWTTKYGTRLVSSKAIPHRGYGMVAYTKVTSPLRRYYDLLSMWQLDAALRGEHEQKRTLLGQEQEAKLVFSEQEMNKIISTTEAKHKRQQRIRANNNKHWFCQMLAHSLHFGGDHLPARMTALLGTSDAGRRSAFILELDYMCWVKQDVGEDGNMLNADDIWEVEIDFVALNSRLVWLRCKRRISTA